MRTCIYQTTKSKLAVLSLACCLNAMTAAEPEPKQLPYVHDGAVRHASIYQPLGAGPFPVMVFNQATAKPSVELGEPAPFAPLARFYNDHGWVLCVTGRPALLESSTVNPANKSALAEKEKFMAVMDAHAENIAAVLVALRAQSFIDEKRIFVSGHSGGAISTLLLAEKKVDVRGFIVFSPGVKNWRENELLREAMIQAVRNASAPIFLIQPENDYDLQPTLDLGPEVEKKKTPNRVKILPPVGKNTSEAHGVAFNSPRLWEDQVFHFIEEALMHK
jgi:dienelactone hydrolase